MPEAAPRVSIVVPVLNGAKYLRATLDTVTSQTFTDWEMVVADGGSTDGTLQILAEYQARYPSIRISSEKSASAYHAIYRGARLAHGEFVFLLAVSDGYLDKEWFAKCVDAMDRDPEVSLVWGIPFEMTEEGELLGPNYIYAHFLQDPHVPHRAKVAGKVLSRIDLRRPSTLVRLVKKAHPANVLNFFHMLRKEDVPQKQAWFRYWLKTGTIFPDGNMCVSRKAFLEFLPPLIAPGSSDPGDWMEFFFEFNANGFLAQCIPVRASFGRNHGGQISEVFSEYNDRTRQDYFRRIAEFKTRLKKDPASFVFKDRAGNPIGHLS
jgi:glycosyltransferase involved in cell wall biosynthesis